MTSQDTEMKDGPTNNAADDAFVDIFGCHRLGSGYKVEIEDKKGILFSTMKNSNLQDADDRPNVHRYGKDVQDFIAANNQSPDISHLRNRLIQSYKPSMDSFRLDHQKFAMAGRPKCPTSDTGREREEWEEKWGTMMNSGRMFADRIALVKKFIDALTAVEGYSYTGTVETFCYEGEIKRDYEATMKENEMGNLGLHLPKLIRAIPDFKLKVIPLTNE
ncbi:hypothetical protein BJ508DRAFT_336758 [Ascobolus immersus RN42]|uniref:Uncharacterized protein n=1 Tax=Ascobolus immersus RN42 TaxID=1160509 RepID=A0A3N4HEE3_ASCIM|nr:hypothetical protein BJ508DRAFT_336758 [Ascobolus immersus RN42]